MNFKMLGVSFLVALFLMFTTSWLQAADPQTEAENTYYNYIYPKVSDGQAVEHFVSPLQTDSPMTTFDGSTTFDAKLQNCPGGNVLEVSISPGGGGELTLSIRADLDFDGTFEKNWNFSNVSGVCTLGYVSCSSGTWTNCHYYKWVYDGSNLTVQPTTYISGEPGVCFCTNASCGSPVTSSQVAREQTLAIIGGAVLASIQKVMPSFQTGNSTVSGYTITYTGLYGAGCYTSPYPYGEENPSHYYPHTYDFPYESEVAAQSSDPDSPYYYIVQTVEAEGIQAETQSCEIRHVAGVNSDNIYRDPEPSCTIWTCDNTPPIPDEVYRRCDFTEDVYYYYVEQGSQFGIRLDCRDRCVPPDGSCWDAGCSYPDGAYPYCLGGMEESAELECSEMIAKEYHYVCCCEKESGWDWGTHIMRYHYEQHNSHLKIDRITLGLINGCETLDSDESCKLIDEQVCDHEGNNCVYTMKNGTLTGLTPTSSCFQASGIVDQYTFCADGNNITVTDSTGTTVIGSEENSYWVIKRTYRCTTNDQYDFSEALYRSQTVVQTTAYSESSGHFTGYSDPAAPVPPISVTFQTELQPCQYTCKVNIVLSDTRDYPGGDPKAKTPYTSYSELRECYIESGSFVCPYNPAAGESIAEPCACRNDFARAVAIMQTIDDMSHDLTCSSVPP